MEGKEIKQNQDRVKLAGGIILFMGTICSLLFFAILITGELGIFYTDLDQDGYSDYTPFDILATCFMGGIIYTPLGYFVLYKKNRWVAFSVLILLVFNIFSTFLSGGGSGTGIILVLIVIPIYKGTEAAFKLHTHSIKNMEKSG